MKSFASKLLIACTGFMPLIISAQVRIEHNSSTGNPQLQLLETSDSDDNTRLYFQNSNFTSEYWSITGRFNPSDANSNLRMYFNGNSTSGEVMTLTGEKRVGIGTTNPGARFTISQSADQDNMGFRILDATGNHTGRIWMNGGDFHLQKGDNALDGLVIKDGGKIGAFTDSPDAKFDIYETDQSANDDLFLVRRDKLEGMLILPNVPVIKAKEDMTTYIRKLGVFEDNPTDQLHINTSSTAINPLRVQVAGSTKLRVLGNGGTSIGGNNENPPANGLYVNAKLHVGTTTGSDRLQVNAEDGEDALRVVIGSATKLRVLSNGGTSIGSNNTTPPTNGLYVSGNLLVGTQQGATGYKVSIDGKVICEELTVELESDWPDYVFCKEYELLPPLELERLIHLNGHLPEVPSKSEIGLEGIHVSEMVTVLLKKVEELTLYMINQDKKISLLQAQLDSYPNNH